MPERIALWKTRARSLERAGKQFRQKSPEAIHDLRVALRRVSATATALGRDGLAKRSRRIVSSLSDLRQIEVDRDLLARVRKLGWLPDDVAAGVDARWDALLRQGARDAARRVPEDELERLRRKLGRLSKEKQRDLMPRLDRALEKAEKRLTPLPEMPTDRALHRYRLAVKEARYVTEDLALAGRAGLGPEIEQRKQVQDALGRWNDLRLFRRHLLATRKEAERRGAVTFVLELDRLAAALEPAVASARDDALRAASLPTPPARSRPQRAPTPASNVR
ncbi:MAG: CHAD domain-containing protein [Acidobacteria bacterium]|nr:CHAD domain-containing protein [Acidobacteriota bacterium]MCA1617291.1 CHAD domain-containing protein [Acidobacteriota bacterium]